jgi:hypothetical protein
MSVHRDAGHEPATLRRLLDEIAMPISPCLDFGAEIVGRRETRRGFAMGPISDKTAQDRTGDAAGSECHLRYPLRSRHVQQWTHETPLGWDPVDQECQFVMRITDAIRIPRDQCVTVFENRSPIEPWQQ